jgi:hypothetical protein
MVFTLSLRLQKPLEKDAGSVEADRLKIFTADP